MGLSTLRKRAWTAFILANGELAKLIEADLAKAGVVSNEVYDVLVNLECAQDHRLRMSELAEVTVYSPSGATRLADRMAKAGLIKREGCPMDRRSVYVCLTERGLRERLRAWEIMRESIDQHFGAKITAEEAEALEKILRRFALSRIARFEASPGYLDAPESGTTSVP